MRIGIFFLIFAFSILEAIDVEVKPILDANQVEGRTLYYYAPDGTCTEAIFDDGISEDPYSLDIAQNSKYFKKLARRIFTFATLHGKEFAIIENSSEYFEQIVQRFLGQTFFRMSDYHQFPERTGTYGRGEVSDKVRITLINGILNYPEDHIVNLEVLSNAHHGANIHYVFRGCNGWSHDIIGCLYSKLGFVSSQATLLADTWCRLIEEMGGVDGGGLIIHYAHSIGGTETINAQKLMTPQELKMIRVYTLASPSIIYNGAFESVMNYVSLRDGVSYIDVDYFLGLYDPQNCIQYIDTIYGPPLVDHLITSPSYSAIIERLGQKFIAAYGEVQFQD